MKRKKILLYNPKAVFYDMPLALLAIGSALDAQHYEVVIVDGRIDANPLKRILEEAKDALCFGVTSLTGNPLRDALKVTRAVRNQNQSLPIIWGGWHSSLFAEETLRDEPAIDITVQGQGESTFKELVSCLESGADLSHVQGITYRNASGEVIKNPGRALEDMNFLPRVDYELIDVKAYFKKKKRQQFDYISSTGCRFRCTFCADPFVFSRKWTAIEPDRMGEELAYWYKKYGFTDVNFQDETFFTKRQRVFKIAEEFLSRGIKSSWAGTMRADQGSRMTEEDFDTCKAAGLRRVLVGVESGSQEMMARDRRFAEKFGLEIIEIIDKSAHEGATIEDKVGKMINSDFLDGMEVLDAIEAIMQKIEAMGIGKRQINYKLRDAIYSRQRYWGEPFPIIYDKDGVSYPMDESDLPLTLPELDDFKPATGAKSPLARATEWVNQDYGYTRETDTMPGFAGSSWYFLRYMDAHNDEVFADPKAINYWQDVDLYVGGTEHAVGHLMYSRFWHKFLYDKGLVPTNEPFKKLINQGMIQGVIEYVMLQKGKVNGYNRFACSSLAEYEETQGIEFAKIPIHVDFVQDYGLSNSHINLDSIKKFIDWRPEYKDAYFECGSGTYHKGVFDSKKGKTDSHLLTVSEVGKMSKRYFNVVNPDDVVDKYGADCFRMYEMFLGPVEQAKPWDTKGIDGVIKFLRKFWHLYFDENEKLNVSDEAPTKAELKVFHTAIKKINYDIERFSFNTCVSSFMVVTNELKKLNCNKRAILEDLVVLIAPFAPYMAEELWHQLGKEGSVHQNSAYPQHKEEHLKEATKTYPIAINGKVRANADFAADAAKDFMEKEALALDGVQKWLEGKTVRKVIVVPGRMINIVVS